MNELNARLVEKIIEYSVSNDWIEASQEWYDYDMVVDSTMSESCICSQPNLKYQFTIKNKINEKELFPIGSECIKFFQDEVMTSSIQIRLDIQALVDHVLAGKYIAYDSPLFTRKVLTYLHEHGAFKPDDTSLLTEDALFEIFWKSRFSYKTASVSQIKTSKRTIMTNIIPYCKNFNQGDN